MLLSKMADEISQKLVQFYVLTEAEWRLYASVNWTSIGSDYGLSPVRQQASIWNNAGLLLIGPFWTNFSEILIKIKYFSHKAMILNMSSAKW